jgi:adenine-specific DNA-methyltransferase
VIKYIGSKRRLVPRIVEIARGLPGARTVLDLFSGTTRVAQGLKMAGFQVTANDLASYSEVLATCYVATDARLVDLHAAEALLARLNALPGEDGYFTRTFCEEARYLQPKNGRRVDAIRAAIDRDVGDPTLRALALTALLEAADRVDSTTGLQMAYLKSWAPRSHRDLELRLPALLEGSGRVLRVDAREAAECAGTHDIAYLDPPYNQHSYFSNYHVWETLVRGDTPEAYGVARKREDCRTTKSDFNSRRAAWSAFSDVIARLDARRAIISFNDEGFFAVDEIRELLATRFGEVAALPVASKRYVGAQIGIHNPAGERVGEVSHLRNTEWLFVAGAGADAVVRAAAEGVAAPSRAPEVAA